MKRKRILPLLMAMVLLFTGCGSAAADTGETAEDNGTIKLRVINAKSEVGEQMNALASAFNSSQSEIEVEIETIGASVDIQSTLKGYYLADDMPDIISCQAGGFDKWAGLLVDLKDEPWASDTDAAFVDATYGTVGFPYTTEAIGFIYNADVLSRAGIDPSTLTTPSAYADAFATLDAQKEALGLTAVVDCSVEKENLHWSSGNHLFGAYLDSGLARDDTTYIDLVEQGKLDPSRAANYASFLGLIYQYSDPALLTTATYDEEVDAFASGRYAFITQGSWIGSILAASDTYKAAGSFPVGMAPYAFEDGMDTILTSPPSWWAVMKEGNVEASKEFLRWCAGDAGQKILVEDAGFISPFKSCKYVANDPFAQPLSEYLQAGKTSNWHWMNVKEGVSQYTIAPIYFDFAAGTLDAAGFVNALQNGLAAAYSTAPDASDEVQEESEEAEEQPEEEAAEEAAEETTEETTEEGGADDEQ